MSLLFQSLVVVPAHCEIQTLKFEMHPHSVIWTTLFYLGIIVKIIRRWRWQLTISSNSSMSNLGYIQMSLKDPLLSVSLFCHLASIILCALILSETLALYKSFTYLLTYLQSSVVFNLRPQFWPSPVSSTKAVYPCCTDYQPDFCGLPNM